MSIIFGLITAVMFAASTLIASRSVRLIGSSSTVAWMMLVGLVGTLPIVLFGAPVSGLEGATLVWWVLAGAGNLGGLLIAYLALRIGKVGLVAPVVSTEGAIAAVIAAALGEPIAVSAALLLGMLVIGVVISAVAKDPEPIEDERPVLAVALAVAAALTFGVGLYAVGRISGDLPLGWVLLPPRLLGVVAVFIPLLLARRLRLTRKAAPLVVAMGLLELVGFSAYSIGAQDSVAITAVLASQFAPIAAVLAFILFRERLGRLQIAGVSILVVGVAALSLVLNS